LYTTVFLESDVKKKRGMSAPLVPGVQNNGRWLSKNISYTGGSKAEKINL
jgi:hypothetical protein